MKVLNIKLQSLKSKKQVNLSLKHQYNQSIHKYTLSNPKLSMKKTTLA